VPAAAVPGFTVSVELPPAVTDAGSDAVAPLGTPERARATVCALPEVTAVEIELAPEAPPCRRLKLAGLAEIEKLFTVGLVTATAAEADLLVSATLVAVTTKLPALMGAVYIPPEETFPPLAFQVTDVLLVPLTLAENCWLLPNASDDELGNTATATETGAANPEPWPTPCRSPTLSQ